jgi:hypothetical protein
MWPVLTVVQHAMDSLPNASNSTVGGWHTPADRQWLAKILPTVVRFQSGEGILSLWLYPLREPGYLSDVALGYGLDDRGFESRHVVRISLFTTASRTSLGPTQPPIQWVPGALSLGVKRQEREADHSPPSSAEVKNAWSYTSTPPYVFMTWCLIKHTFTLSLSLSQGCIWIWIFNSLNRSVSFLCV